MSSEHDALVEGTTSASVANGETEYRAPSQVSESLIPLDPMHADVPVTPRYAFTQNGSGSNYQAVNQNIQNNYRGDHVLSNRVSAGDLRVTADNRFLEPKDAAGMWSDALAALREHGVVILVGPHGSGRRTAAIRLLRKAAMNSAAADDVFDLEPEWESPRVDCLRQVLTARGVLDMSEPTNKEPEQNFGKNLANLGQSGAERDRYLVVLTTPEIWRGRWIRGTEAVTFSYVSPDAKELVRRELVARGHSSRQGAVDETLFTDVWSSNPKAEDAVRLAELIARSPEGEYVAAVDEYREWRGYIEGLLAADGLGTASGAAVTLSKRATLWSAAFLDGGSPRSVIAAADALLKRVGLVRKPAEVLGGQLSSERLKSVAVEVKHDQARVNPANHGLREAVLNRMWEEFSTQHNVLRDWAVSIAADPEISDEEAKLVVDALTEASIRRRDGQILSAVRDALLEKRRTLVVDALTRSALDHRFGSQVRNLLYQWAMRPASRKVAELIADVCAGEFGRRMPERALVRLGHAAQHAPFGSPSFLRAFETLIEARPGDVLTALEKWREDERMSRAGKFAFLALNATKTGRALLVGEDFVQLRDPEYRQWLVGLWHFVLAGEESRSEAERCLGEWGEAAGEQDELTTLFTEIFISTEYRASLTNLCPGAQEAIDSRWGRVLVRAVAESNNKNADTYAEW